MAREMKDSGVEWIGEIPREWEVGKVKNCFVRKNEKAKQENPIILSLARSGVKIRDISTGEGQIAESYFNYNPVEKGDLLINPMDLYSGANCSVSKVCGVISPAYINLKSINGNNSTYYDYYFKTQYWSMVFFAHGKGVSFDNRWTLNTETLFNYFIPIPPLEEQEKIANYLDKKVSDIDLIIEKTKATIEDYKKYKHSIITEAVTKGINPNVEMKDSGVEWIGEVPREWEVKKLKYVAQLNPKIDMDHLEETSEVTFTPMEKIKNGYFINNKGIWGNNNSSYTNYSENDIVMAKVTPCFENGNIAIMKGLYNNIGFGSSELFVFRSNKNIKKEYLFYFLRNEIFKNLGKNNMTGAGGLKRVSSEFILNFNVSVPPLEEQNQIVEYLDKKTSEIDTLITKKEALIAELEEYKKSLIYECVTGKKEIK